MYKDDELYEINIDKLAYSLENNSNIKVSDYIDKITVEDYYLKNVEYAMESYNFYTKNLIYSFENEEIDDEIEESSTPPSSKEQTKNNPSRFAAFKKICGVAFQTLTYLFKKLISLIQNLFLRFRAFVQKMIIGYYSRIYDLFDQNKFTNLEAQVNIHKLNIKIQNNPKEIGFDKQIQHLLKQKFDKLKNAIIDLVQSILRFLEEIAKQLEKKTDESEELKKSKLEIIKKLAPLGFDVGKNIGRIFINDVSRELIINNVANGFKFANDLANLKETGNLSGTFKAIDSGLKLVYMDKETVQKTINRKYFGTDEKPEITSMSISKFLDCKPRQRPKLLEALSKDSIKRIREGEKEFRDLLKDSKRMEGITIDNLIKRVKTVYENKEKMLESKKAVEMIDVNVISIFIWELLNKYFTEKLYSINVEMMAIGTVLRDIYTAIKTGLQN